MKKLALTFLTLSATCVYAAGLPKDTVVRIEGRGIEAGWHQGKIMVTGQGCMMVALQKPTRDGYTMIALIAIAKLQKQQGDGWAEVSVRELQSHEPRICLEDGAD